MSDSRGDRSTERNAMLEKELFGDPTVSHERTEAQGINFDKYDNIPVEVNGESVPEGVKLFSSLELDDCLTANVKLARYERPTPIQKYAIPTALAQRDLMACAQTGSGKTAAFLLPTLQRVITKSKDAPPAGPQRVRQRLTRLSCVQ